MIALIDDGVAAVVLEEERFDREKQMEEFPRLRRTFAVLRRQVAAIAAHRPEHLAAAQSNPARSGPSRPPVCRRVGGLFKPSPSSATHPTAARRVENALAIVMVDNGTSQKASALQQLRQLCMVQQTRVL